MTTASAGLGELRCRTSCRGEGVCPRRFLFCGATTMTLRHTTICLLAVGILCVGCPAPSPTTTEQFDGLANLLNENERALSRIKSTSWWVSPQKGPTREAQHPDQIGLAG